MKDCDLRQKTFYRGKVGTLESELKEAQVSLERAESRFKRDRLMEGNETITVSRGLFVVIEEYASTSTHNDFFTKHDVALPRLYTAPELYTTYTLAHIMMMIYAN